METLRIGQPADEQGLVSSYFEQEASYWAEIYARQGVKEFIHQERLRIMLEWVDRLGLRAGARVLDAGCGAGLGAIALAKKGYLVEAIDPARGMIDLTCERARNAGVEERVNSRLGDIHHLCFPDRSFNLVIAMGVLPWLKSIGKPLREMGRVLVPGSYLVLTVDNRWGLSRFLDPLTNPLLAGPKELARKLLPRFRRDKSNIRSYLTSARECDAALGAGGLEKLKSITLGFGPFSLFRYPLLSIPVGLKLHRRFQALADRGIPLLRATGAQYMVLARRRGSVSS